MEDTMTTTVLMYTVVDADARERFSTTDFKSRDRAERRCAELQLKYGKEHALEVWGIDDAGRLVDLESDDEPCGHERLQTSQYFSSCPDCGQVYR